MFLLNSVTTILRSRMRTSRISRRAHLPALHAPHACVPSHTPPSYACPPLRMPHCGQNDRQV